jgi:hypothetical protein
MRNNPYPLGRGLETGGPPQAVIVPERHAPMLLRLGAARHAHAHARAKRRRHGCLLLLLLLQLLLLLVLVLEQELVVGSVDGPRESGRARSSIPKVLPAMVMTRACVVRAKDAGLTSSPRMGRPHLQPENGPASPQAQKWAGLTSSPKAAGAAACSAAGRQIPTTLQT